ncbi:MAG TPA: anthranilate synthase component I [Phycisphaerales bacterium]|nr:anthranilate synthase component I [Phycisphaerales bacterium]
MPSLSRDAFAALVQAHAAGGRTIAVPIALRVLSDQLTPVLAYRRLVAADDRKEPSFLFESVEGGERQGRYSILGNKPRAAVIAKGTSVRVWHDHAKQDVLHANEETFACDDPLALLRAYAKQVQLVMPADTRDLPACVLGGWFGCVGYDSVRYAEPEKLPFSAAPRDDRDLPDVAMYFFDGVTVFDHVEKVVYLVALALCAPGASADHAYEDAIARLHDRLTTIERHSKPLRAGLLERDNAPPGHTLRSNMTRDDHAQMILKAKEYIKAGDIFQVVLGQRFERESSADPFDVYRALRTVNPSPYMVYMQAEGCILVASSPEILCRVRKRDDGKFVLTNRPLAGTRRRGRTPAEDTALEAELRADAKERAEHIMLVDLGRNDVGRVAEPGSITLPSVLEVERYSHVMHLSSTVTGVLRDDQDCWDALAATLPVGTISGAPKVRAMQIIDELEPIRRGPYGGGMGYVSLDGQMDIALTLRTIVAPFARATLTPAGPRWTYHLQAAGGIVADSVIDDEFMETVNKSAALARAIDVAERAFRE